MHIVIICFVMAALVTYHTKENKFQVFFRTAGTLITIAAFIAIYLLLNYTPR